MHMGMVLPEWAEWIINPSSDNSQWDFAYAESHFLISKWSKILNLKPDGSHNNK
jgi:hypothetical protein